MASSDSWATIESDPGVFTELIERLGVQDAEVQELYDLDGSRLRSLRPVYGVIFLFKWQAGLEQPVEVIKDAPGIYFAKQTMNNACATQALISILLNHEPNEIDIGETLRQLQEFTKNFPPDIRGMTIASDETVRRTHNSFAAPEAFIAENVPREATEDDDVYHFVSYIHRHGFIWELDGLQSGPIRHCECSQEDWLEQVGHIIEKRIALYAQKEIRFNLMALVKDKRREYRERLQALEGELEGDSCVNAAALKAERFELQQLLQQTSGIREKWCVENARRKHNYIPLIFNILQVLAERDELLPLIRAAEESDRAR